MHPLLQELHQDHVNLSRVLGLLEKQVELLGQGRADLHILSEIVDYVQAYPDLIHHPREDLIFLAYRDRYPAGSAVIDQLLEEHRTLIAGTADIKKCVDQWRNDAPVPREHLESLFGAYLRLQRDHLNREEGEVYGLVAAGLTGQDWERIEAEMPRGSDPLSGDLTRRGFENLYDQVMAYAGS